MDEEEEEVKPKPRVKPIEDWHGRANKNANIQQKAKNFQIDQWALEDDLEVDSQNNSKEEWFKKDSEDEDLGRYMNQQNKKWKSIKIIII